MHLCHHLDRVTFGPKYVRNTYILLKKARIKQDHDSTTGPWAFVEFSRKAAWCCTRIVFSFLESKMIACHEIYIIYILYIIQYITHRCRRCEIGKYLRLQLNPKKRPTVYKIYHVISSVPMSSWLLTNFASCIIRDSRTWGMVVTECQR